MKDNLKQVDKKANANYDVNRQVNTSSYKLARNEAGK